MQGQGTFVRHACIVEPAQKPQEASMPFSIDSTDMITAPPVTGRIPALILDEESGSRECICGILKSLGMRVFAVESLDQITNLSLEILEQIRLLVLSTTKPGSDPRSLLHEILPLFPRVPVVFLGTAEGEDYPAGNAHVVSRLTRPVEESAAASALQRGFDIGRMLDELLRRNAFRKYPSYIEEPIARVIHDINNQMTGLKGGIDLLCYSIEMIREPATQAKFMRYMEQFIQPSLAQIEQLTSQWRRLRENRLRPLITTNLVHILKRAIPVAASPAEQRRIRLLVDGVPVSLIDAAAGLEFSQSDANSAYHVKANPEQISLALTCLVQNALDAIAERDGGTITISVSKHEDDRVAVCIKDTGDGVSEAILPLIWRSFYTTKGEWRNGIGLCIAKQIIDKHQGQIDYLAGSQPGACFRVLLHSANPEYGGSE